VAALSNGEFALPDSMGGSVGDMCLMPDLDFVIPLSLTPGWAWAPADQYTQEGEPTPGCQRTFLKRIVARAAEAGLEASMAFEFEWFTARDTDPVVPYHDGPSFSANALSRSLPLVEDILDALDEQGMQVERFHPECSPGQFEVSLSPTGPLACQPLFIRSSANNPISPASAESPPA
jgi:glutamine synthetase